MQLRNVVLSRAVVSLLCVAVIGLFPATARAQKLDPEPVPPARDEPRPSPYRRERYEEDWSGLRGAPREGLDRLKFVPLGDDAHLTVGGDARVLGFVVRNEFLGVAGPSNQGLLTRVLLHGHLSVGPWLRVFVEPRTSLEWGRSGPPVPLDRDLLALNAGFVDLRAPLGGGKDEHLALRLGRQELQLGSGRLVAYRDGPNSPLSFDGVRAMLRIQLVDVDVFALAPVVVAEGAFDNRPDDKERFWGAYARLRPSAAWTIDGYGLHLRRPVPFPEPTLDERTTLGSLVRFQFGMSSAEVEGSHQVGSAGARPISASSLAGGVQLADRVGGVVLGAGLGGAISTGDRGPATGSEPLRRFVPPYPTGQYLGPLAPGVGNLVAGSSRLFARLGSLNLGATGWLFFRESLEDGIYALPGFPLRPAGASSRRWIGSQVQLLAAYEFSPELSLAVLGSHFFPGPLLEDLPPDVSSSYLATIGTARF